MGFITLDNETKSKYFVHRINLNGALDNDRVAFQTMESNRKENELIDAVVTKIIKHEKDFFVCLFNKTKDGYTVKPDDEKMYYNIILDDIKGLVDNQKILVKIKKYENKNAYGYVSRMLVLIFYLLLLIKVLSLILVMNY